MDEIVNFFASSLVPVIIVGVVILLLKLIVVYLLIATKKPKVAFTQKSIKSVFKKKYSPEDIKKSKKSFRVFLKKANNSFKSITYTWLIILALCAFFKVAIYISSLEAPIEKAPTSTPTPE